MNIDNFDKVKEIIAETENAQVEFKETTGQLERGMETLCAFLNGTGGTVLFGVNDKGKIIGQELSDKTKRDLVEAIKRIEPLTDVGISYVPIPSSTKFVIVLNIEAQFNSRPFTYKGRAYYRMESVTSVMPQETYNHLLLQRGGKYGWEAITNDDLTIDSLDADIIRGAVRAGVENGRLPESTLIKSLPIVLQKFDLLSDNGKLKNAAAVLFGTKLSDYPQCLLRMARFKGTDKSEFIDNQRTKGNVFQLLDAAMAFFFKHLSLSGKIEGLYREEELTVPYKALRECCINALAHRSYHEPGSSVSIAIYDNRIEVTNTGSFSVDKDIEHLISTYDSKPKNPIMANVLYKSKILESWGRGINLMVSECRRVGLPDPIFHADGEFVQVVFRLNNEVEERISSSTPQYPTVPPQYPTVSPQLSQILSAIAEKTLSTKDIMVIVELKDKTSFLNTYLYPAIEQGFVEPLYPNSPNHPRQKYRLTEKGLEWLKQQSE